MERKTDSIDLAPLFHPDTIRLSRLAERLDDGPHHGGRIDPLALVITQREEATGQAGIDRYPMLQLAVGRAGMQIGQVDLGQLHPPVCSYLECRFHILKIVNLRHISIMDQPLFLGKFFIILSKSLSNCCISLFREILNSFSACSTACL